MKNYLRPWLSLLFIVVFAAKFTTAQAQLLEPENLGLVKWLDLKTAQELNKKQPKPFLIDVYTDWCGWCKHMMKTTFSNPGLAAYINAYFYPVRFDAESKDTIEFLDKKYINKGVGNRPPNELAIEMLEGKLSYPTTVFYNNDYKFKLLAPGYMDVKTIEPLLVYAVEYIFNTTSVADFQKYYQKAFYPDSTFVNKDSVLWMHRFNDATKKNDTVKRKTMVFVNTSWCNGGKAMMKSTFNNSEITDYINKNFHAVYMDAMSKDSITYDNKVYVTTFDSQAFNPFLQALLGNQVAIPCTLFFDEDMKFLTKVNQYLTPEHLDVILHYFNENAYKTQEWDAYVKTFSKDKK